jgi:splicing factor 45
MISVIQVDDDLEGETREECSKYGEVIQVIIYEIPHGVVPEEAVRIFVQFNRIESAIKGTSALSCSTF